MVTVTSGCVRDDGAGVLRDLAGADAAAKRQVAQPRIRVEVEAVEHLALAAEVVGRRHVGVDLAELVRIDVAEAAERLAAVGQPRIDRHRDAVGGEVGRGHRAVLRDGEVACTTGGSSRRRRRGPLTTSCCTLGRELPVVRPGVPAGENRRVIGGRAGDLRPEAEVGDLPAGVDAAGRGRALGQRVDQVAVRGEVAVGVGPGPGHARDDPVAGRDALGRIESQPVLADVRLDGRLAVAEDVVGAAHARREVLELVEVLLRDREVPVRHQRPGSEVVFVPAGVVVVEPQAGIDREPVDGPAVLDEERPSRRARRP